MLVQLYRNCLHTVLGRYVASVLKVQDGCSHDVWSVSVNDGAESQAVSERRGHIGNLHIAIASCGQPTPLLERLHSSAPGHLGASGFAVSKRIGGRGYEG